MSEQAIDVIVRTGGRPAGLLHRAVRSLARQSAGDIRLLLVRHGPADVEALQPLIGGALHAIEVMDAPGANRGRAMGAGLAHVAAPRFAFLDDDDYLLENHFLHLLDAFESVAAPAFAYCDILVLDEGAPEQGLRLFRAGPAEPPLGRITDRISVHAFLAARAALEGLPFDRWNLATVEDALLVASLLARSAPVHTPHATCVYVQGRGDASAYLAHPDRAADELTFAREIAPLRATIEAKFGGADAMDETTYLAPFISAARHATLFAELKERAPGAGPAAVRDGALTTPLADDPGVATQPAPLAFTPIAGTTRGGAGGGVEIESEEAYAHAARLPLDAPAQARIATVAVHVTSVGGAFGVGLADSRLAIVVEARVDAVPIPLEMQLPWDRPDRPTLIVRRLDALDSPGSRIRVEGVDLAFACRDLVAGGGKAEAQAALESMARAPRAVLSSALAAAPTSQGRPTLVAPIAVDLGEAPWAYAFSMPLPPEAAGAAVRVDLGPSPEPVFVLRVDAGWAAVGERLEAPAGPRPNSLWLEPLAQGAARLVIQAGPSPGRGRVTLRSVFLYPDRAA